MDSERKLINAIDIATDEHARHKRGKAKTYNYKCAREREFEKDDEVPVLVLLLI